MLRERMNELHDVSVGSDTQPRLLVGFFLFHPEPGSEPSAYLAI